MRAKVTVYDVTGRLVRILADGVAEAGEHHVAWDGKDAHGRTVSSGLYFCRLTTPAGALQHKMMVLR
jgi:flagellar hook assembly protein FlgD